MAVRVVRGERTPDIIEVLDGRTLISVGTILLPTKSAVLGLTAGVPALVVFRSAAGRIDAENWIEY